MGVLELLLELQRKMKLREDRLKAAVLLTLVGLVLAGVGCGGSSGSGKAKGVGEELTLEISADPAEVEVGGETSLSARLSGPRAEEAVVEWGSATGTLSAAEGLDVKWTAPNRPGSFEIYAVATADTESVTAKITVRVRTSGGGGAGEGGGAGVGGGEPGEPELSVTLSASPRSVGIGNESTLSVDIQGADPAGAEVEWAATEGELSSDRGTEVSWRAPLVAGTYSVKVKVTVGDEEVTRQRTFTVGLCDEGAVDDSVDPCIIKNVHQLQAIGEHLNGYFKLGGDIDASETREWNDGKGFIPIGTQQTGWRGALDGASHTVEGLFIHDESGDRAGLFRRIEEDATVSNLHFETAEIICGYQCGILVGYSFGSINNVSISNSTVDGASNSVGGLVGIIGSSGRIERSRVEDSSIRAQSGEGEPNNVGGLLGYNYGTVSRSHSTRNEVLGGRVAGGLVGFTQGMISRSYSLSVEVSGSRYVGGLAGATSGSIALSYSLYSEVRGEREVGGLVGFLTGEDSIVGGCYSASEVIFVGTGTPTLVGGLIGGADEDAEVLASYWDREVSKQTVSAGGERRTTAQMKTQSTYEEWDFTSRGWSISGDYPDLQQNRR